jgi:hypothetical protein
MRFGSCPRAYAVYIRCCISRSFLHRCRDTREMVVSVRLLLRRRRKGGREV